MEINRQLELIEARLDAIELFAVQAAAFLPAATALMGHLPEDMEIHFLHSQKSDQHREDACQNMTRIVSMLRQTRLDMAVIEQRAIGIPPTETGE